MTPPKQTAKVARWVSEVSASAATSNRTADCEHSRSRLAADNARLEEALRAQDAVLTAVAHDLKHSLGVIRLRTDILLEQLDEDSSAPGEQESPSVRFELARIVATT